LQDPNCCPDVTTAEIFDFPRDSFYEARYVSEFSITPYLDTETIKWSDFSIGGDIEFAYIIYPAYLFKNFLNPFISLSYRSDWIIVFIGLLFTSIFTSVISPVIFDVGKDKFKTVLTKKTSNEQEHTTIIVSGKGDEKVVEINNKDKRKK